MLKRICFLFVVVISIFSIGYIGCTRSEKKEESENILRLYSISKIKGLDPIMASDLYAGTQVVQVYEGLLQYHYLKRPYQLEPNLAESMPKVSNGGKTYTFKIKKGIIFQDDECFEETKGKGRELVAEDFVYSWKRLADPKLLSTGWWVFDGKIQGLDEWREEAKKGKADYSKTISGLKATDRYTLEVTLNEPSNQFLYFVAMPFTLVVPREAVEYYGKDFLRKPVGTGPFRLVRGDSNLNSKMVWEKSPTYREVYYPTEGERGDKEKGLLKDAGKRIPFVDKVVYEILVESQPQWLKFMAGKLDVSVIPKDNYEQAITPSKELAKELTDKGIKLIKFPSLDITYNAFNMLDPVLGKNKYLRQAMSLALNQEPFIELFYNGRALPAQGPIPPGLSGYSESYENPYRKFNIEKAKELLAKAGYPEGKGLPEIVYSSTSSSTARQMNEYTVKSLAAIGVKVKPDPSTWPEFQKKINNRKAQMWGMAWSADYPDAENFLQLFYSKNAAPGSNGANYNNKEFDRLFEKSLTLNESPERTVLYEKMVKILVEDAPWIWGVHRLGFNLMHKWTYNFKPHEFEKAKSKYVRIDYKTRAKGL